MASPEASRRSPASLFGSSRIAPLPPKFEESWSERTASESEDKPLTWNRRSPNNSLDGSDIELEVANAVRDSMDISQDPLDEKYDFSVAVDYSPFIDSKDAHTLTVKEICARYGTHPRGGLSTSEHERRLNTDGPNVVAQVKPIPDMTDGKLIESLFFGLFFQSPGRFLMWVTVILAFVQAGTYLDAPHLATGMMILMVILIQTIQRWNEVSAMRLSQAELAQRDLAYLTAETTVIRGGKRCRVAAESVVVGDLVELAQGSRVPADVRIITHTGRLRLMRAGTLIVATSAVEKAAGAGALRDGSKLDPFSQSLNDTVPFESISAALPVGADFTRARNLALASDVVAGGHALGVVFATGVRCAGYNGDWRAMEPGQGDPGTAGEVRRLEVGMTIAALVLGASFLISGLVVGHPALRIIVIVLVYLWIALPERCVTLVRSHMRHMHIVLSEELPILFRTPCYAALARPSHLLVATPALLDLSRECVENVYANGSLQSAQSAALAGGEYDALLRAVALSNDDAFFDAAYGEDELPLKDRHITGESPAVALLQFVENNRSSARIKQLHPELWRRRLDDASQPLGVSLHASDASTLLVVASGRVDAVLGTCTSVVRSGVSMPINADLTSSILDACEKISKQGDSVLCFAQRFVPIEPGSVPSVDELGQLALFEGLSFLGFVGLHAPVHTGVDAAVAELREAGIRVVYASDDSIETATAVARAAGILHDDKPQLITFATADVLSTPDMLAHITPQSPRSSARGVASVGMVGSVTDAWSDSLIRAACESDQLVLADMTAPNAERVYKALASLPNTQIGVVGFESARYTSLIAQSPAAIVSRNAPYSLKAAADLLMEHIGLTSLVPVVSHARHELDNLSLHLGFALSTAASVTFAYVLFFWFGLPLPLTACLCVLAELICRLLGFVTPFVMLTTVEPDALISRGPLRPLMSGAFIFYVCAIAVFQMLGGFVCYIGGMNQVDIHLANRALTWGSTLDALGAEQRQHLVEAQSAYFIGYTLVMIASQQTFRTRVVSLFHASSKKLITAGLVFVQIILLIIVCYGPALHIFFGTDNLRFVLWLPGILFGLCILGFDELRKWALRRRPNGWLRFTYFYR